MKKTLNALIALFAITVTSPHSSFAMNETRVICESKGILYSLFKKKAYKIVFDISDLNNVNASLLKIKYNLLFQKSISNLAELNCTNIAPSTSKDDPNAILLSCNHKRYRDTGYQVLLSNPDIAGRHKAMIYEITFAGSKKIAKLKCSKE